MGHMTFKGNFGELNLTIEGEQLTGTYQEGRLEGTYIDGKFEGTWENKGLEGRVEFTIQDGHLKGTWKKGLEPGAMRGQWFGDQIQGEGAKPEPEPENEPKMHPDFRMFEWNEPNILACAIASLTRHMMLVDRRVEEGEISWMHDVIHHFEAQNIPVGQVWDEVDDSMQILEMVGAHAGILERSARAIEIGLDDQEKNFLMTAFQNIVAQDDVVTYEEFEALRYTLEQWFPGKTAQLIQNFKDSGIRLDFDA
jgi:uncharacterized tellurite resistance protein B-like protein